MTTVAKVNCYPFLGEKAAIEDRRAAFAALVYPATRQIIRAVEPTRTDDEIELACARIIGHWCNETGSGASLYNWNLGNIVYTGSGDEFVSGDQTAAGVAYQTGFRAYKSLAWGIVDYVKIVSQGYPGAWAHAFDAASAQQYLISLRHGGYFTGLATEPDSAYQATEAHYLATIPDYVADLRPSAAKGLVGVACTALALVAAYTLATRLLA